MARHIDVPGMAGTSVNETELAILRIVARDPRGVVLSSREAAVAFSTSMQTAVRSLHLLEEKGLIEVHERYLRSGGRLSNEYMATKRGRAALSAIDAE